MDGLHERYGTGEGTDMIRRQGTNVQVGMFKIKSHGKSTPALYYTEAGTTSVPTIAANSPYFRCRFSRSYSNYESELCSLSSR